MEASKSTLLIGYLSAFGYMLAAVGSASCTQALQGAIPDFQLSVIRPLVQLIVFVICGKLVGEDYNVKRETIPGLVYLGFASLVFNVGYYGATTYLPLIENWGTLVIAQIVIAFLHSRFFFCIKITRSKIVSLLLCIVGILLTAQPTWPFNQLYGNSGLAVLTSKNITCAMHPMNTSSGHINIMCTPSPMNTSSEDIKEAKRSNIVLGYIMSAFGGAAMGSVYDINGKILEGITPIVKVTYSAAVCLVGSFVLMFYMEDPVLSMTFTQFFLYIGHGILSVGTTFFFMQSGHHVPGPTLSASYYGALERTSVF